MVRGRGREGSINAIANHFHEHPEQVGVTYTLIHEINIKQRAFPTSVGPSLDVRLEGDTSSNDPSNEEGRNEGWDEEGGEGREERAHSLIKGLLEHLLILVGAQSADRGNSTGGG